MKCVILFLCFCATVYGSPNSLKDPYICGPPSCAKSEKFHYSTDVIYNYDYTVNVETYFSGSSNNRSTLDVRALTKIQFITPCEGLLQLSDVTLNDQDANYPVERAEKFVLAVTANELRFAYHDGYISEICPHTEEEDWVLNFKRAILSLFQNSMKRFDINFKGVETDIHGTCNVDYTLRGQQNTSLILVKTRDLSQCTSRYKYMSILQTVRYDFQSKFQTWPVLKSESKCRITVDHHIYKEVNCRERHLFEPFSGKNSGAMTTVIQDLSLVRELNKTDTEVMETEPKAWSEIQRRSNLLHHHMRYLGDETGGLKSARDVLKLLCMVKDTTDEAIRSTVDENMDSSSTVGLWGRLVRSARPLYYPALAQLLERAGSICTGAKKHILDALPYIASTGSVELIKDMIMKNAVDKETRHEWLMSMAMIPRPKIEMLDSMAELLSSQRNDKVVSFTVSSMVHSYCRSSGKSLRECCEEATPRKILEVFETIVSTIMKKGVIKSREDRTHIMIAIKALGNIGGYQPQFADELMKLIGDAFAPIPVRLAAIDAFRRTPCLETREYFLATFREDYMDIEIRLASYLQVMRCPNLSTIRKIFHALRNEPSNQAATFVWSHLKNLGSSSLPSRVEIQGLLSGNTMPQLEDRPDFRLFSRNVEQSVFFDQYNAGGSYEANVIFSPDSYIPRSLSLNLTVDMFGESINLLEMKARAEGFERYFEGFFGANGPFNKDKMADNINNLRYMRSTSEADEMRAKIDDLNYKNEALKHRFPMAELGIRVFGNEISYWNAEGDEEILKSLERLNPQLRVLEILSGKEISYNKASLFLDTTFSVPTGCGLPMNMNLMGTSYVNTKMSGTVNDKIRASGNLEFQGKLRPSVAVNIAATMSVVADGLSSSGIRINWRLYTATGVGAKLSVKGAGFVKLDLELPDDKQEIFAAKSELIILHGETEHQQQGLNQNRIEQSTCSWSTFDNAIGIKVCAAYQFPNMTNLHNAPYFLMSGPAKYILSLEKADTSARTYAFQYQAHKNRTTSVINLSFDTPDSKEKRMITALLSISNTSSTAALTLQSAKSTIKAKAMYNNQPYDKSLEASLEVDGRKQFDTVMSLQRHDIKHGYVWIPHAYWLVDEERVAELTGVIKMKSKGGVTQCDIKAEFQTKQLASSLNGFYTLNGPTHATKLQLDYRFFKSAKQTIQCEGSYSEKASGYRRDMYGDLEMKFTAYPVYDFYAVVKNIKTQSHVDISLNVSNSKLTKQDPSFSFAFIRFDKLNGLKLDTRLTVKRPRLIDMKFQFEGIGPKYTALALLNFNPKSREILVSGYLFYPPGTQLYIDADLNMTLPTLHPCTVRLKVHEKQTNDFQVNAAGVWFTGTDFNIDANYQDLSKSNMASHHLKVLINSSHFKNIAIDGRFTQDSRQITFIGDGEYNDDKYRTIVRYILLSEQNFTTYAEVDVSGKVYSVNLNADLNNNTNLNMDIHFDQLRDVHISYQRWVTERKKRLSAAFNWDANRDPSQKVSIDIELDNKGTWHHGGHVTLYYPGRMVNGEFEFLLKDWFCEWFIRMGWSRADNILWRVKMYSEAKNETVYALLSNMNTPFQGWQDTSFNVMWRYHDNLQALNGSMNWQKDYLSFSLLADYLFLQNSWYGEISARVNSTIPTLPKAHAVAIHRAIWKKKADTLISFQYNEDGLLMINSSWAIDSNHKENNISGKVTLLTPFQGYRKGFLETKFILGHKKDIKGVTFLDLEEKVLKIYVDGHMRRITNCMLVVNVTSPMIEFSHTTARFGFVEGDRHLVAMVVTPNTTTGIEVLLKLQTLKDFHVFGHVALPIQYLNRAMVTAKRGKEELDFRVGWSTMDFGFTGIWQWRSAIDFEYVYKLYTPLEGFEENGLVLKHKQRNGLDTELSIRLSKHKFGVAVQLVDNGKGLIEVISDRFKHGPGNHDVFLEDFDTSASVVLDTLYYPTVSFHAHLMKVVIARRSHTVLARCCHAIVARRSHAVLARCSYAVVARRSHAVLARCCHAVVARRSHTVLARRSHKSSLAAATQSLLAAATPSSLAAATQSSLAAATPSSLAAATQYLLAAATQSLLAAATQSSLAAATPSLLAATTQSPFVAATPLSLATATLLSHAAVTPSSLAVATLSLLAAATQILEDTATQTLDDATTQSLLAAATQPPSITTQQSPPISDKPKFIGPDDEDVLEANATLHLPDQPPIVLTDVFILESYTSMRNTLNLKTPFPSVSELKSIYTVDIVMGQSFNVTCLVLLYNGTYWHEISSKIYYEYEIGEDDTYQSYIASIGIATPLAVLPGLEAHVGARLEDALWKMSADITMASFVVTAVASLELEDPFVETSGSLNLTSPYLEDYFIKMEFKKDFSDVENVVGGGIQINQGNQSNFLFADVTWSPTPSHNIRFNSRGALSPVLSPSSLSFQYSAEGEDKELAADFTTEGLDYSLKADTSIDSISVALSTPHDGYRAMKIITQFEGEDITGSLVTDSTEYAISGKVFNREPLEISVTLVPKGQGEKIEARIKLEASTHLYILSAHLSGAATATLHARAEITDEFTDINVKVDLPTTEYKDIYFKSRADNYPELRKVVSVQATTPLKRLSFIKGDTDFVFGPKTGYLLCKYELPDMKGQGDLKWSFLLGDLFIKALGNQFVKEIHKSIDLDIYFGNSTSPEELQKTDAGFRMDLDKVWQIGTNASFGYIPAQRVNLLLNIILPKPNVDVHTLYLNGVLGSPKDLVKSLDARYTTDVTAIVTAVTGKLLMLPESFDTNSTITWTSTSGYKHIENKILYRWDSQGSNHIDYELTSPIYVNKTTLKLHGSYQLDKVHDFKIVKGEMYKPGLTQIGEIDVRYGGVRHTDGRFNFSTPFHKLPWLKAIFDINNIEKNSDNKVDLFWPNKTATVNTSHVYTRTNKGFTQTGVVSLSVPLSTQHLVKTEYYYLQDDKSSNGNTTIDFDGERFVKGSFTQLLGKSERNLDLSTTDIEVENAHTPVGVKYIHEYDATGDIDVKQATVFHLKNATKFNVTGKLDVTNYDIGKHLKLDLIHGNRTWAFDNNYESKDKELKQGSKMKWAEDTWIAYNVHVTNLSTIETESQSLIMNVWWPLRTFNLVALYQLQDTALDGKATFNWNVKEENKTAELRGSWENPPNQEGSLHKVDLALSHPSFRRDVNLKGHYLATQSVMSNLSLELQYSDNENEYLKLHSVLTDNSIGPIRDYSFALTCTHPSSNLDLDMKSDVNIHSRWYYINTLYRFQKSLFYQKLRNNKLLIDMNHSLIEWERKNETYYHKVNSTWDLTYPDYKIWTVVTRPTGNDTGLATLSMKDMSLIAHLNSTDDISYHVIGRIIDARSAKFDAWRNYDDVTTVDLASYIRLNHSRLMTSKIAWRPQIFTEVKSTVVYTLKTLYSQINDTLVILKEAPMEAHLALKNIWSDAKPRIREFLDDLNDLHVIKDDLDEFELFLNQSYNNNDFYVKNVVEFTYNILDEMAIRNHLESLPGIVNDMWGMMGNTSRSIKDSLTYVVDSIKMAYSNFLQSVNKVLEADFMELVSERLEAMILQYDNFIRDLHMKFLEYWEVTWVNATNRLVNYWHELLKSIEPLFFKILHYTESFVFTIGKGVMDFFYNRTQELTDSPYFNYVSTFGHEMDKIYKDLVNNDLITNIKKYSKKLWNTIWNKIEKFIPFKDELTQLYTEFRNAWQNFLKTKHVVYVMEKYQEAYTRLKWWYDYFLIGEAIETVGEIIYAKLTDLAKTALQYEEMHRTPKTNFIFDPRVGEILLEQKLPFSWHAFNRTPDFTEVAEYKAVRDFMDEWLTTNKSIWSYYYEIRPYMDFNNLLPPFEGMAMMTGQGTLVTFDKRVFTVSEAGTFLLTKDYKANNFTLLMESNDQGRYNLVILTHRNLIHIDIYKAQVTINGVVVSLPILVDGWLVVWQTDGLEARGSSGLGVQCDTTHRTCKLTVQGWYYGVLGGLLGTYNNEQYDDLQLSNNTFSAAVQDVGRSWNLLPATTVPIENKEHKNDTQCEKFFANKLSPLHPCFSVIDASPLYLECMRGIAACSLAHAYLQLCTQQHVPAHLPDHCDQCSTPQGDTIEEGEFHALEYVPKSTDVVFIIEAQYCNRNIRKAKNMDLFIEAFDTKLQANGLSDNRYAIVGFGGRGTYRRPRALYVNSKVFTNAIEISQHFDSFTIQKADLIRGNRSSRADMFAALSFATDLPMRPGVPRTFILLPCSKCDLMFMKLDYSTIYHNLMENSVTLHIIMDDDFMLSKKRVAKYLFGVDSALAYTNKDYERLVGDAGLKKQVKLPKEKLGLCTSLAMETNGSIFAGAKLQAERATVRRFSSVVGGRISQSAAPCSRAPRCECRGGSLRCAPCPDTQRMLEMSFFNTDDIDDLIDMAMDPSLPSFS